MKYILDLDKQIHQMRQQNKTLQEIANAFGISRETVRRKLQRHWRWQIHQERRNMAKTLTISVPEADYEFYRYAWEELADEVISDDEAGQRGAKRSVMFLMICTAGITNFGETVRLLKEIKNI